MRWTRAALLTRALPCGRRSRVVLTPRRWRQVGGNNFRRRWWQTSPVTKESTKETVNTIACGNAGCPGATVVTNSCAFYTLRTRLRVRRAPGIPHALCRADCSYTTRAQCAARMQRYVSPSLRGAKATKQSTLAFMLRYGLLRFARNDGLSNHALAVKKASRGILSPSVHIAMAARPPW